MSHDASVSFDWADGHYRFRLPIEQLLELQVKCDAGPPEIHARLASARWRVEDLRETIRLGLIGGGLTPVKALELTRAYVDQRPLHESVNPAFAILTAALVGVPGDQPEEGAPSKKAGAETGTPDGSPPRSSTASPRRSTARPKKSAK